MATGFARWLAVAAMVLLLLETQSEAGPGGGGGRRPSPPGRSGPPAVGSHRPAPPQHAGQPKRPPAAPHVGGPRQGAPTFSGPRSGGNSIRPTDRPTAGQLHDFVDLPSRPEPGTLSPAGGQRPDPSSRASRFTPDELQAVRDGISTQLYDPSGPEPFTPAWYFEHPNAWKATYPYAPAAAVGFATVAAWVGLQGGTAAADYGSTATVNNDYPAEEGYAEDQQEVDEAAEQAESSQGSEPQGPWMPLGVFALLPPGQTEAHVMLQLSVNQQRVVQGTWFDLLTEATHPVRGSIDPETRQTAWTVGAAERVVYQTDLSSLTGDEVPLRVHFGDRQTQQWTMVRIEQAAGEGATP